MRVGALDQRDRVAVLGEFDDPLDHRHRVCHSVSVWWSERLDEPRDSKDFAETNSLVSLFRRPVLGRHLRL